MIREEKLVWVLWAVLRVASMFRQYRTQAFTRSRIAKASIVTDVLKKAFLLVCKTGSLTFPDLNRDASRTFQYSLSQSPLWLVVTTYSARILSQSPLWLCIQLPSLSLPCSTKLFWCFFQETTIFLNQGQLLSSSLVISLALR